jgi:phosphate transport system permease protein
MNAPVLATILLALSSVAYYLGKNRAHSVVQGKISKLHSLPSYYGLYTAIWCGIPALILAMFWFATESNVITQLVISGLPAEVQQADAGQLNLMVNDIKNLAQGNITSNADDPIVQAAANHYNQLKHISK